MNPDDFADRWAADQEHRYQKSLTDNESEEELIYELAEMLEKSIMAGNLEETFPYYKGKNSPASEIIVDYFETKFTYDELLQAVVFAPSRASWVKPIIEDYIEVLRKERDPWYF